jgi:hypothetical protein
MSYPVIIRLLRTSGNVQLAAKGTVPFFSDTKIGTVPVQLYGVLIVPGMLPIGDPRN